MTLEPVPQFLQGTWVRRYIRRATGEDGSLGPPNTAPVRYIQTPHAFVDVRPWQPDDGTSSTMAFAGVTTTSVTLPPGAGSWASGSSARKKTRICKQRGLLGRGSRWHAPSNRGRRGLPAAGGLERHCLARARPRWHAGGGMGAGRCGRWSLPRRALPDSWRRARGCWCPLWLRARQRRPSQRLGTARYAAGRVTAETGWSVEMSTDAALEGGNVVLCGSAAEWSVVLPGTTCAWPPGDSDELPSKLRFQSE